MKILTIETTCDETAAAVITDELDVLSSVVASQEELHQRFAGVVPEIAARAHLERCLPVIHEAIHKANIELSDIDAVAVAHMPGLAGSLLVGVTAAKTLAWLLDRPLIGINHLQGHIYACQVAFKKPIFPCIGLIISGGHSTIYHCRSPFDFDPLGGTIDDAAGESFDKVASMLGLPYPGGPSLSKCALNGDPKAFAFPRPFLNDSSRLDFSFSGLKTAVRYEIAGPGAVDFKSLIIDDQRKADIAASFEQAVVDCLVGKTMLAMQKTAIPRVCVGGGVAANRRFREALENRIAEEGGELLIAPMHLCTDNAVLGAIAIEKIKAGQVDDLSLDAVPGLIRS
ncbi:tRNA (adenosine(37)-N6)-threonylcarbamoyltransferase complex transferase subunit TsaD [Blastopirellula marina]|uniref:tRNA N6-adenosine threonylcarbamoyltransferase n=1 Tax=Blastopirellula marina TaxID=124 RepID=A0A2S8G1H0_9BACT|nr:tRNA (adenosine(37)-N6)-threonylcarbamoyltransferase complex transferase subunit TsaD [Blastopirellula marina]PQO38292.1 tRNA (adenosine(37)-N6)-threonylcarbamoyltransferase complex transferase subunit TsaD [Blastopirellula marina]PTL44948.1 tRNA (adenosine(37)-N6)-threonylcarbamoyltransferase complex transferase subunit TsaD [Blastopirellula marina]